MEPSPKRTTRVVPIMAQQSGQSSVMQGRTNTDTDACSVHVCGRLVGGRIDKVVQS